MSDVTKQSVLDFYTYPPVGSDDWRYAYQTAVVRAMEIQMLSRTLLLDMANAVSFEAATDLLSSTEYASVQADRSGSAMEEGLILRRSAVRELFADLMLDELMVELFRTRDDFAGLRLALRRQLTGKPLGTDYSNEGNVPAEWFERIFKEEEQAETLELPDYMQRAADEAVLAYYGKKDIRQIDYAIDRVQTEYCLKRARQLNSEFLTGLFRIQIDLMNIRTMLRLKFIEQQQRDAFLNGGYVETERFRNGVNVDYDVIRQLCQATPYGGVVDAGIVYLTSNKSFLKLEQACEEHLLGFLKTTVQITAGPQPIIAYLLSKENEIRTVRLILTAKKNSLDNKLILDRIS